MTPLVGGVATGVVDGAGAGAAVVVVLAGRGGAGRGLSVGVGASGCSAGTDALGAWTATGGAREVAACGVGPDLRAMPIANAAANVAAAATIGSPARVHTRF